jgi:hypothetical protein
LDLPVYDVFLNSLPDMKAGNTNKWKKEFTPHQIDQIEGILHPLLKDVGYVKKEE